MAQESSAWCSRTASRKSLKWEGQRGEVVKISEREGEDGEGGVPKGAEVAAELLRKGISRVILTGVGDGPRRTEKHLC